MGNCQATDTAAVVIQIPGGKTEKLFWPTPASEIMRSHPGHYVALLTEPCEGGRFTRVRLLRPRDPLLLGHVYRLVTSNEVAKGLRARKLEKMRAQPDITKKQPVAKAEERARVRPRQWRPTLQSIAEAGA